MKPLQESLRWGSETNVIADRRFNSLGGGDDRRGEQTGRFGSAGFWCKPEILKRIGNGAKDGWEALRMTNEFLKAPGSSLLPREILAAEKANAKAPGQERSPCFRFSDALRLWGVRPRTAAGAASPDRPATPPGSAGRLVAYALTSVKSLSPNSAISAGASAASWWFSIFSRKLTISSFTLPAAALVFFLGAVVFSARKRCISSAS